MVAHGDDQRLLTEIANNLGVGTETIDPAYEDPGDWLVKEARLPPNVDPANSELADPEARSRMAKVFDHGLNNPTGYVLPVALMALPRGVRFTNRVKPIMSGIVTPNTSADSTTWRMVMRVRRAMSSAPMSEPTLITIAYAFEQASRKRVPPPDLP